MFNACYHVLNHKFTKNIVFMFGLRAIVTLKSVTYSVNILHYQTIDTE